MLSAQSFCRVLKTSALLGVLALAWPAQAEIIELRNGDRYSGEVIRMDKTNIEFLSEVQGRITIPREKVAAILLHPQAKSAAVPAPETTADAVQKLNVPQSRQLQDVMRKIQREGIDESTLDQVQEQMLSGAGPEANRMFREMAGGLLSGKLDLSDIRSQAEQAASQIEELKADLDDDTGQLLDGYLSILKGFLQKTAPATPPAENGNR
jgi:hypothetical protein